MKISRTFLLSFGITLLPTVALAAPQTFYDLAQIIVQLFNNAVLVLITFGLVAYFWGIAMNVGHFGDEKGQEKLKAYFFWGILILFVMVSIWGIVNLLEATLFPGAGPDGTGPGPSQQSKPPPSFTVPPV